MSTKKGLGRGLGALLGDTALQMEENAADPARISIYKIEPNPLQPRKQFDELELQALADSITANGLIQPLALRRLPNGYYQIIAGERRWRACRLAGLEQVAVILEVDDEKAMELALIENLQRQDLNPVEEALGYQRPDAGLRADPGAGGPTGRQKPPCHCQCAAAFAAAGRNSRFASKRRVKCRACPGAAAAARCAPAGNRSAENHRTRPVRTAGRKIM